MDNIPKHGNKQFIPLFYDKCKLLDEQYTDSEIGQIVRAAIRYDLRNEIPSFDDRAILVAFSTIQMDIDLATEKANKKSEIYRRNAQSRNRDKSQGMTLEEMDAEIDNTFPRSKKNNNC